MSNKIISIFIVCAFLNIACVTQIFAEEITISGNGAGSENQAIIDTAQNNTVTQNNNATIANDVTNNATTGNNTTNSNNGSTSIETGNTNSTTVVSNENINSNITTNSPCGCSQDALLTIADNGADSQNVATLNNNSSYTSSQENTATIKTNITVNANTGENKANNNSGKITINTGDIHSNITINNTHINNNVPIQLVGETTITLDIKNNGSDSKNILTVENGKTITYLAKNTANILNSIWLDLNSGNNEANNNKGNVTIITGDILSMVTITNDNINSPFEHADCTDCENSNNDDPSQASTPPPAPTHHDNPCSANCGSGSPTNVAVAGASASNGDVLPATGSYWTILLTLASLIAFFSGWYLRFRSGVAPGKKSNV